MNISFIALCFISTTSLLLFGCEGFQVGNSAVELNRKNNANKVRLFSNKNEVDVSDLGLTMDDLNETLPPEMFGISTSGYESTSRITTVDDEGCAWDESQDRMDVTLKIPGLRGQPTACLAVEFCDENSLTVTAFGMVVWTCLLRNTYKTDTASFEVSEGPDMTPVITLSLEKANSNSRWGGFIEQIGENSIL